MILVFLKATRGIQIPWDWRNRWFGATMLVASSAVMAVETTKTSKGRTQHFWVLAGNRKPKSRSGDEIKYTSASRPRSPAALMLERTEEH